MRRTRIANYLGLERNVVTDSVIVFLPGSGWAMLVYNLQTFEVHNYWAWDRMHNAPMGRHLLVLDMYEHSHHMDSGAAVARYVDAFMQNVNWEEVNRRLVGAKRMAALA